jgi:glyoxylase-like metal-dependent hydrolase (beta-lactamase superfamily II)
MRVHLCGVRGSTPAPGIDFVKYGGHTSSVAFAHDGEPPSLVVDAGTGLRRVTELLAGEPFRGTILLSHLHWDHVHGLPFFEAGARAGHRVDMFLPTVDGDPVAALALGMSPPHFPIGPTGLGEGWTFTSLEEGSRRFEGFDVTALEIPHKGGRTFGFRITDGSGTIAYLSDHFPLALGAGPDGLGVYHEAALMLADHADLLLHDAQFVAEEFPRLAYLGHSAVEYAYGLTVAADARALALFHHAHDRVDTAIDQIVARFADAQVPVSAATEGSELHIRSDVRAPESR